MIYSDQYNTADNLRYHYFQYSSTPHPMSGTKQVSGLPEKFVLLGAGLLRRAPALKISVLVRRFRALFGSNPQICSTLWGHLTRTHPEGGHPRYLLWALMFLKLYATEHNHTLIAGIYEKTFRKWSCLYLSPLAYLRLVSIFPLHC